MKPHNRTGGWGIESSIVSQDNQTNDNQEDLHKVFDNHYQEYLKKFGVLHRVEEPEEPNHVVKPFPHAHPDETDETPENEIVEPETGISIPVDEATSEEEHIIPEEEADSPETVIEETVDEVPTETDQEQDDYYIPEEEEEPVEEPEEHLVPITEDEEDVYYEPESETNEPTEDDEDEVEFITEEPAEETVIAPVEHQAPVVEREIVREVLVVDREQARDLGYSAEHYVPDNTVRSTTPPPATPTPKPVSISRELEVVNESPIPQLYEPEREQPRTPYIPQSTQKETKKGGGWRGLFGGNSTPKKEETTTNNPTSTYRETSRLRDEGLMGAGSEIETSFSPDEVSPISLRTQEMDAREERLRLQHVMSDVAERRDVDPQNWLEQTMIDALKVAASDLHIVVDGETRDLRVRIRVDGQMRDFDYVQGVPARVIMGRLKAATRLPSGGSFAPQETIYTMELNGEKRKARAVLFRVEDGGEALVMRLPLSGSIKQLDNLDFSEWNLDLIKALLAMPYKLIMIAGPMGSGKTTTAHGALLHVAKATRTVWTIEDPVERRLPNMVQLEVDEENEAGFDVLLSKLLRADYNTLFLGEIRDSPTAAAAVRQAKAGRQVMSTIHADDNIKAMMRLIELAGDSPLSVLSSVAGVISQRLVRRLNPNWDGVDPDTKYKGRVPIHEILLINDEIIEVMMQEKPLSEIKQAVRNAKGSVFAMDAKRLISAGITDEEEIISVIGEYQNL